MSRKKSSVTDPLRTYLIYQYVRPCVGYNAEVPSSNHHNFLGRQGMHLKFYPTLENILFLMWCKFQGEISKET